MALCQADAADSTRNLSPGCVLRGFPNTVLSSRAAQPQNPVVFGRSMRPAWAIFGNLKRLLQEVRIQHVVVVDEDQYVARRFADAAEARVSESQLVFSDVLRVSGATKDRSGLDRVGTRVVDKQVFPALPSQRLLLERVEHLLR